MAAVSAISGSSRGGRIGLLTAAGCITRRIRVVRLSRRCPSMVDSRLSSGRTPLRVRRSAATDRLSYWLVELLAGSGLADYEIRYRES